MNKETHKLILPVPKTKDEFMNSLLEQLKEARRHVHYDIAKVDVALEQAIEYVRKGWK